MVDNAITTGVKSCRKERITTDVQVTARFPWVHPWRHRDGQEASMKQYERDLNYEVKSFYDFLRDHRSQDAIELNVERQFQDVCSACGEEWEPYFVHEQDDAQCGQVVCARCGAVEEKEVKDADK